MSTKLVIKNLGLNVHLGATSIERRKKQKILLTFNIYFSELPKASRTDQLEDTICYDKLIQQIKKFIQQKEFNLIEHLGYSIYLLIKNALPNKKYKLQLAIEKYPPIAGLESAIFAIDELQGL